MFHDYICDGCHDLLMLCLNLSYIIIITVIGVVGIYKKRNIQQINIKNRVYNYYFYNLLKAKNYGLKKN